MNETLMSKYLTGDRTAPEDLAARIAVVLEVEPEALLQPAPEEKAA